LYDEYLAQASTLIWYSHLC